VVLVDDTDHKGLEALEPGNLIPPGIWTLADVQQYGRENTLCPYFAIRRMVG
jgi:DNA excision repair protein ERCC-2